LECFEYLTSQERRIVTALIMRVWTGHLRQTEHWSRGESERTILQPLPPRPRGLVVLQAAKFGRLQQEPLMASDDIFQDLREASITALRKLWEDAHGVPPPDGLGRELLTRGISWKRQEKEHGGLAAAQKRELHRLAEQLDRSGDLDIERQLSLKSGTRLVREWQGRTCHVTVLEKGFMYEDRRYTSLTQIARTVTGTNWSGPRFFGLRQRSAAAKMGAGANG
jgi:hypothetical protein